MSVEIIVIASHLFLIQMNKDVIQEVTKRVKGLMKECQYGTAIFEGGKEDALATFEHILQMLEDLKSPKRAGTLNLM